MQKGSIKRAAGCFLCLCMLLLALCGCTDFTFEATSAPQSTFPVPDTSSLSAPVGDSSAPYSIRATLYFRTADNRLSSALRLITVESGSDPLRLVIEALLEPPYSTSGLLPIAPSGTTLNSIRLSGGVVTVDLSAQALSQGEEAFFVTRAAIAKTLLEFDSVDCVNVLVEGRAAEAGGMPLGALVQQDADPATGYVRHLSDKMHLKTAGTYIERHAVIYIPGNAGVSLAPVCIKFRLSDTDATADLLSAFAYAAGSEIFSTEELLSVGAYIYITSGGKRVVHISLPDTFAGRNAQESLVPALISTLGSFLPNIDAASVSIGSEPVLYAGAYSADENGLFDPSRMRSLAGYAAKLYFPDETGALVCRMHTVDSVSPTARDLLCALMAGPADTSLLPVFPQGTSSADILGIRVENGTAHVNLSPGLYSACQSLSADEERALVYSIANTLVYNSDTVLRVQFYIDGVVTDTLAGNIVISSALMANPGLVRE